MAIFDDAIFDDAIFDTAESTSTQPPKVVLAVPIPGQPWFWRSNNGWDTFRLFLPGSPPPPTTPFFAYRTTSAPRWLWDTPWDYRPAPTQPLSYQTGYSIGLLFRAPPQQPADFNSRVDGWAAYRPFLSSPPPPRVRPIDALQHTLFLAAPDFTRTDGWAAFRPFLNLTPPPPADFPLALRVSTLRQTFPTVDFSTPYPNGWALFRPYYPTPPSSFEYTFMYIL